MRRLRFPSRCLRLRSGASKNEASREALLAAATTLFARVGFDGATVRDIADAAGVNVSLVSYHFAGKEGLYSACIEQFGRERLQVCKAMLEPPETEEEFRARLRILIEEILNVHLEQREITTIVLREADAGLPVAGKAFKDTFLEIFQASVRFFSAAQEKKIIRGDIDPMLVALFVQMSLIQLVRLDPIAKAHFNRTLEDAGNRKSTAENLIKLVLGGVMEKV